MFLLFDIGGTKMRIAVSRDKEKIDEPIIIDTPQNYDKGILMFKKVVDDISLGEKIKGVAGGIRGVLNKEQTMLENDSVLLNWQKKPFKKDLEEIFKAPVYIKNDSAMAGLGEAVYGAGKDKEIVVYITISTGVGGARIVQGRIDSNRMGFEPGKQIINCKNNKTLEYYISGLSLEKRYNKKPTEIKDEKILNEINKHLAYGLYNTILHWSPDIIVLGGGLIIREVISIDSARKYLSEIIKVFPEIPEIKKAELGDIGGLYGALAFLKII